MRSIDSSAWVEFAMGGPLAGKIEPHMRNPLETITPSIVVYEVYKRIKRDGSEDLANTVIAEIIKTRIVPLDDALALAAADTSLSLGLAMADAIIYATAQRYQSTIVTCDADFKDLPNVIYLKK